MKNEKYDYLSMPLNIPCVVVRNSKKKEFMVGDKITRQTDGSLINEDAQGWIAKENISEAVKGMLCEVDTVKIGLQILKTEKSLRDLAGCIDEATND